MQFEKDFALRREVRLTPPRMISAFRPRVKRVVGSLTKSLPGVRSAIDHGLTVFAFHDVTDSPSVFAKQYGLYVSIGTFKLQIEWIRDNFQIVHPSAILSGEPLPARAAVITFDDGYHGTFENGLPILEGMHVPSIIFLNMQPILRGTPLLSAMACFLEDNVPDFSIFCRQAGLHLPYHLSLNPRAWEDYQSKHKKFDLDTIIRYQGAFANVSHLHQWDGHPMVCYGNHLHEHWNAMALSADELGQQFLDNEQALSEFSAKLNLFAFTNGQPNTCFSQRDVSLLQLLGAAKVFSTVGGVNADRTHFLIGRVALCESDNTSGGLWFRIFRAIFNKPLDTLLLSVVKQRRSAA